MLFNEPLPLVLDREVTINMDFLSIASVNENGNRLVTLTTDGSTVSFIFGDAWTCGTGLPRTSLHIPLNITVLEFYAKLESKADPQEESTVFINLLLDGDEIVVTIQSHWLTVHDEKYKVNAR